MVECVSEWSFLGFETKISANFTRKAHEVGDGILIFTFGALIQT
jgi:hypothetical protein